MSLKFYRVYRWEYSEHHQIVQELNALLQSWPKITWDAPQLSLLISSRVIKYLKRRNEINMTVYQHLFMFYSDLKIYCDPGLPEYCVKITDENVEENCPALPRLWK